MNGDSQLIFGQASSISGSGFALTDWLQLLRLNGQEVKQQQVPGTHTRKNLKFWLCVCLKTCTLTRTYTHTNNTRKNTLPYSLRESFTCNLKLFVSPQSFSQPQNTTKGSEILKKTTTTTTTKRCHSVKSAKPGKEEKKNNTELKAFFFHKTPATTTHKKQILLSKKN